jgi:uncharacterized protein (UPF0261 family)
MQKGKKKTILLMGTLDTKAEEIFFIEKLIKKKWFNVIIINTGTVAYKNEIDNTSTKIINISINALSEYKKDKYMSEIVKEGKILVNSFYNNGKINGVMGIGGGTGTSIGSAIMQSLPKGFPKLMVSTITTGKATCGPYFGTSDITIMHSIVDLQGINYITARIFSNAVGAICGMVNTYYDDNSVKYYKSKKTIALSMMGTTTKGALRALENLEKNGFQVISFHQNGTGGIAMEEMIKEDIFQGVFDLSLHEVGDRELGGLHGAIRPIRLETAGEKGIPQLVVPGCLVYYVAGPIDTLSSETRKRKYFMHSPELTLVRATPKEMIHIGKVVAEKLNKAKGPVSVCIPLRGFCEPDKEGSELFDPEGNIAFMDSLKKCLSKNIPIVEVDAHINDSEFIDIATEEFLRLVESK